MLPRIMEFAQRHLRADDVRGKSVIEVGSRDVNGSVRYMLQAFGPCRYLGVDLQNGPGVDEICSATDLVGRYGPEVFDVLISTELLEHVRDWKKAVSNFKRIVKPNGILFVTTRAKGFPYHGHPFDFWRYERSDIELIFSDLKTVAVEDDDPDLPGVLLKAVKPPGFKERNLDTHELYSIIEKRPLRSYSALDHLVFRARPKVRRVLSAALPAPMKRRIREWFRAAFPAEYKKWVRMARYGEFWVDED